LLEKEVPEGFNKKTSKFGLKSKAEDENNIIDTCMDVSASIIDYYRD
jgi:hypothetical protein